MFPESGNLGTVTLFSFLSYDCLESKRDVMEASLVLNLSKISAWETNS